MRGAISVFLSSIYLCLSTSSGLAQEGPIIAIFDMEDKGSGLSPEVLSNMIDYLSARLAEEGYKVVPRGQIQERIKHQQMDSHKICYDQACQIELGRELAAKKSLATKILRIGNTCQVTAVMYDLKKATTERAATAEAPCGENQLMRALKSIVEKLCSPLTGKTTTTKPDTRPTQTPRHSKTTALEVAKEAPSSPYNTWGHTSFWSGLGLIALGGVSAYMSSNASSEYDDKLDPSYKDKSRIWAGVMWAGFGTGAALAVTGVILWVMEPTGDSSTATGFVPFSDGQGFVFSLSGRW